MRDLWREGKPYNAMECLAGLSVNIKLDILEGRKKFEGDTREGDGSLSVIDDEVSGLPTAMEVAKNLIKELANNIMNSKRASSFLVVPKNLEYLNNAAKLGLCIDSEVQRIIDNEAQMEADAEAEREREEKRLSEEAIYLDASISRLVGRGSNIAPPWSSEETFKDLPLDKRELMRLTNTNGRQFHEMHIEYQTYLYRNGVKKEKANETHYNSAWIAPDGSFYGCPDIMHSDAAGLLCIMLYEETGNAERKLEKEGWIKLSAGTVVYFGVNSMIPTIAQWETVLAWMRNPINKQCLSGKRVYNVGKDMYFSAALIEQNINATK